MSRRLITLSHSTRPVEFERITLNFLTKRYSKGDRLCNPPPLHSLSGEYLPHYIGNVTLWSWDDDGDAAPTLRECIVRDYKAQHALVIGDSLVICGTAFIEIYPLESDRSRPGRRISHPWFSGGHTVFMDERGMLAVSCSAPDAILVFDWEGNLVEALRMPESIYGTNYELRSADDLRRNYIHNDLQLTHINCAFPNERGYLCSTLIQGAIGLFRPDRSYVEIVRGFVGCHGVRTRPGLDGFYFADTVNGNLIEMDWHGKILRRFSVDSRWLHDVEHVGGEDYLFSLSDRNRVEIWDTGTLTKRWELDCTAFGSTCQFLNTTS